MCLTSSRLSKSLWTPGIGIQNHLFGQLPWIRSWRNCNGAGKPSKTSSRDAPCRVHEKGGKNNSSRLGDTTLVTLAEFLAAERSNSLLKNRWQATSYRHTVKENLRVLESPSGALSWAESVAGRSSAYYLASKDFKKDMLKQFDRTHAQPRTQVT